MQFDNYLKKNNANEKQIWYLKVKRKKARSPGIEPGSQERQSYMITITLQAKTVWKTENTLYDKFSYFMVKIISNNVMEFCEVHQSFDTFIEIFKIISSLI